MFLISTGSKRLRHFVAALALLFLSAWIGQAAWAQDVQTADSNTPEVKELIQLLQSPAVQEWLKAQSTNQPQQANAAPADTSVGGYVAERVAAVRAHLSLLIQSMPLLGRDLDRAAIIFGLEFEERGFVRILLLILVFIGAGYGAELLFWYVAKGMRRWIIEMPIPTASARLKATAIRFAFGLTWITAFAIGSVGSFLIFDWPPLLREIVLGYIVAYLGLRLTLVTNRLLLAPGAERYRVVPMSTAAAWFWHRRIAVAVGFFMFARVTLGILKTLGVTQPCIQILAYSLGLILLTMGLEAVWRRPMEENRGGELEAARRFSTRAKNWLVSGLFVLLWATWAAQMMQLFWLLVIASALPFLQSLTRQSVTHLLRPGDTEDAGVRAPGFIALCLERGLRSLFIVGAALLLADTWHIDLVGLTATDTIATRLLRGAINAVVIILIANFLWHVAKGMIDAKVMEASDPRPVEADVARRRSRLKTLLPIFRNVLFVTVLAVSAMMVLSSLGVEIGPLIAGAGVVGVAVGFGAQAVVKDVISGIFYLLDDAFRVGEYIQSGSYKGTVESFSLRSIRLRHHRGPLYTVPFGELGAVQNMSRDWVIDKNTIGITYDSDLAMARKIIKEVGKQLKADPEFGPNILEPMKMQGVEQFGEYAVQIRTKMMTKPGEQFPIRRKAFAMIKQAFDENGIKFAFPTVQVAQGEGDIAAAARQALELTAAEEHEPA